MPHLRITGGIALSGTVAVGGAKNAALPIMAAAIMADGPVSLRRVPRLSDVKTLAHVLDQLGLQVRRDRAGLVHLRTIDPRRSIAPAKLVRRMRASFCVLGPLLARRRRAVVALPGGCRIGPRPVDVHLHGLTALGAEIRIERGHVVASSRGLKGARIDLRGPRGATVTGTANVMMAACLARGTTRITRAATEPEIVDLGSFLNSLGAQICGLGADVLCIHGVDRLTGGHYEIIPDRVEAATLLLAAAVTGGCATVTDLAPGHLTQLLPALQAAGCQLTLRDDRITLTAASRPRPVDFTARAFPGLATDVQPQWTALATMARGQSRVRDEVFPSRFGHVPQLRRMGAVVAMQGAAAIVDGVPQLVGAEVTASDLRAGAALVLAGLAARGETIVRGLHHLDRGYERLEEKLIGLGARLARVSDETPEKKGSRRAAEDAEEVVGRQ